MRNVEIRKKLKQEGVLEKVQKSQWRWREALEEVGSEWLVKRVYEAEMEVRRGRKRATKEKME